nr:hypothetical protein SEVIR_4G159400v2 [Setaria viridis]
MQGEKEAIKSTMPGAGEWGNPAAGRRWPSRARNHQLPTSMRHRGKMSRNELTKIQSRNNQVHVFFFCACYVSFELDSLVFAVFQSDYQIPFCPFSFMLLVGNERNSHNWEQTHPPKEKDTVIFFVPLHVVAVNQILITYIAHTFFLR